MKLGGSRLIGFLLVWMAVGFFVDGITQPYQFELTEETGQDLPEPSLLDQVVVFLIGATLGVSGAFLLLREPGEGVAPGVALGADPRPDAAPRRCYRCRKKWPAGAEACPHCGATRLG